MKWWRIILFLFILIVVVVLVSYYSIYSPDSNDKKESQSPLTSLRTSPSQKESLRESKESLKESKDSLKESLLESKRDPDQDSRDNIEDFSVTETSQEVIQVFDTLLDRNPTPAEMNKYSSVKSHSKLLKIIMKDYNVFSDDPPEDSDDENERENIIADVERDVVDSERVERVKERVDDSEDVGRDVRVKERIDDSGRDDKEINREVKEINREVKEINREVKEINLNINLNRKRDTDKRDRETKTKNEIVENLVGNEEGKKIISPQLTFLHPNSKASNTPAASYAYNRAFSPVDFQGIAYPRTWSNTPNYTSKKSHTTTRQDDEHISFNRNETIRRLKNITEDLTYFASVVEEDDARSLTFK